MKQNQLRPDVKEIARKHRVLEAWREWANEAENLDYNLGIREKDVYLESEKKVLDNIKEKYEQASRISNKLENYIINNFRAKRK